MATLKKLGRKSWENCYKQCSHIKNDDEFNINLVFKGLRLLGVEDDDVLDDIYIAGEEGEYSRSRITIKEWNDVLNNAIKYTNKELLKDNFEDEEESKYTFIVNMIGNTLRLLDDDIDADCDEIDRTCSWFSERNIYTSCEEEIIREIYDESKSRNPWYRYRVNIENDLDGLRKEIVKYLNSEIKNRSKSPMFLNSEYGYISVKPDITRDDPDYGYFYVCLKKDRIIIGDELVMFMEENTPIRLISKTFKKYFNNVKRYSDDVVVFYNKGVSIKDSTNLFFKIFVEICKKTGCLDGKTNLMESFNSFAQ